MKKMTGMTGLSIGLCLGLIGGAQADSNAMQESPAIIQQRAALHPLHAAVRVGDLQAVEAALASGVNVNQSAALEMAILLGHEEIVDALIDAGADLNRPGQSGDMPLAVAARRGNLAIMQRLIDRGADIHRQDRRGMSALDHAQRRGQDGTATANFLRRQGARERAQK